MKRPALLFAVLFAAACGQAASSGVNLPPCGPAGTASLFDFQPTDVQASTFGSGAQPSPAPSVTPPRGFQISATGPGAQMTVELLNDDARTVEALCLTAASGKLAGGLDVSSQQHSIVEALVAIDAVDTAANQAHGRVVSAWFTDSSGNLTLVRDIHFIGSNAPIP